MCLVYNDVITSLHYFSMFGRYPCVYLACKVEEFYVPIDHFAINVEHQNADEAIDLVLSQELLLMQMLHYHLTVHHPYRPVEGFIIDIKVTYGWLNKVITTTVIRPLNGPAYCLISYPRFGDSNKVHLRTHRLAADWCHDQSYSFVQLDKNQ